MNVGLFIKDFAAGKKFDKNGLPIKSGAEFHGENHALQLIKRGHHVAIMAKKRYWFTKARETIKGIDLVRLHAPFRGLEILVRLCTTHRHIDVIYILGISKFSVWAILYARFMKKRVIMSLTGTFEVFKGDADWRTKIFTRCSHYIAISNEIKDGLIKEGGISKDKITVLGQGIDTQKYALGGDKRTLRRKYNFPQDVLIVLFCARIVARKGIDILQAVWPKIHENFPAAKLVLVGGGENKLVEELKTLSDRLDKSILIVGEVDNPAEYYQLADIYFFPSKQEGLPTTLMEAMACGLPSVVSDIGGCSDLIADGQTGYRVASSDSEGFERKLCELLENPAQREIMGNNAARFVREHCDYDTVITELEKILGGEI